MELGDLLLQVVFHARVGQEDERPWSVDDVAAGIVANWSVGTRTCSTVTERAPRTS